MKLLYFFLISFVVCGSVAYLPSNIPPSSSKDLPKPLYFDPIDAGQATNAIQRIVTQELSQRYKLSPCGFGSGGSPFRKSLMLAFETHDTYTATEARTLLINCANIFAANVNAYRPIRPYLTEYPFPISRIEVEIYCINNQNDANPENLRRFSISNDKITYVRVRSKDSAAKNSYDPGIKESYFDALAIVKQEGKSWTPQIEEPIDSKTVLKTLSERRAQIKQKRLSPDYLTTKYPGIPEAELNAALDAYGEDVAEKYDLLFHRQGRFLEESDKDYRNTHYGLSFQSEHKLSQDEARLFATTLFRDFYKKLLTDPIVKRYHAQLNEDLGRRKYPSYITPEPDLHQICWKLAFWDKNVDRPEAPYIAEIQFKNAAFHYYTADPTTHALTLIFQEPYDEAIKHIDQQK